MEQSVDADTRPFRGLKGDELIEWAWNQGRERCLEQIGHLSVQESYLSAVARTAGVEWPDGFFASTLEVLVNRHR